MSRHKSSGVGRFDAEAKRDTKTTIPYNPVYVLFYGMSMREFNLYARHAYDFAHVFGLSDMTLGNQDWNREEILKTLIAVENLGLSLVLIKHNLQSSECNH